MVAAVGLVLLIGSLGFVLYEAVQGNGIPPDVVVTTGAVVELPSGYLVEFRAVNQGEETAAGVIIEGRLEARGRTIATSSTTIDYIPSRSERAGGLFFREDPRMHGLTLRALGYAKP